MLKMKKTVSSCQAERRPANEKRSLLAALQRKFLVINVVVSIATVVIWWETSPLLALLFGLLVLFAYTWVLALEMFLASLQHGADPAIKASQEEWLIAWFQETKIAFLVFVWRQPFFWKRFRDSVKQRESDTPVNQKHTAVVFIHGLVCNRGFWHPWMRRLREDGGLYVSVNLEPVFADIDYYAGQIEEAVTRAEALSDFKPVLVCHSMGGLVARAWLVASPGNRDRIKRIITIGTPHHGTWLARWSQTVNGKQMRLSSTWIRQLEAREVEAGTSGLTSMLTCWYSNADNIVFPPRVATMKDADNRFVSGVPHVALAFHPRVMNESLAMLTSGASSPKERTIS